MNLLIGCISYAVGGRMVLKKMCRQIMCGHNYTKTKRNIPAENMAPGFAMKKLESKESLKILMNGRADREDRQGE